MRFAARVEGEHERAGGTYLVHVALPLAVGGAIYLLARPDGLRMFAWARALGLGGPLGGARVELAAIATALPSWAKWSLPDALWAFALMRVFCILWNDRLTRESAPWLSCAAVVALGSEAGQAFHVVPGTFDPVDLVCLLAGVLAGLFPVLLRLVRWSRKEVA